MDRVARPAIHKQLVIAVGTRTRNRLLYIDTSEGRKSTGGT